jgi:hypothetical protein
MPRKAVRTYFFDKRFCTVAVLIVAAAGGLGYFRTDLPMLHLSSAPPRETPHGLPSGSILIPYGDNGLCRLRAIDTATGQVREYGTVNCLDAADQNTAAWKSLVDQQKASEIRKSFRRE